jgi:hypothetical protein
MEMEGHIYEKSEKLRQLRHVVQVSIIMLCYRQNMSLLGYNLYRNIQMTVFDFTLQAVYKKTSHLHVFNYDTYPVQQKMY